MPTTSQMLNRSPNSEPIWVSRLIFWLALLVVFTIPWRDAVLVFTDRFSIGLLIGGVFGLVWVGKVLIIGEIRQLIAFHVFFVLFTFLSVISVSWSIEPTKTLSRSVRYVYFTGFLIALWDTIRTRRQLIATLQAWVLGGMVMASTVAINAVFQITDIWYNRTAAIGHSPNITANFLALTVIPAWYLAQNNETPGGIGIQLANYLFAAIGSAMIFTTASRGGIIAFVPGILIIISVRSRYSLFRQHKRAFAVAAVVAVTVILMLMPSATYTRIATLPAGIAENLSGGGRVRFWLTGLEVLQQNPILGIGSGSFRQAMVPYFGREHSPHNTFVSVVVEFGVIGLLVYGSMVVTILRRLIQDEVALSRLWVAIFTTWFIAANTSGYQTSIITYTLFTLILVGSYAGTGDVPAALDEMTESETVDSDLPK